MEGLTETEQCIDLQVMLYSFLTHQRDFLKVRICKFTMLSDVTIKFSVCLKTIQICRNPSASLLIGWKYVGQLLTTLNGSAVTSVKYLTEVS